ncbi:MAG: autotransporter domain-containing protein, partial [Planctomycetes bacterium]|nr:autotransporter domain-containing protein [Planctomycetota bacterium]
GTVAITSEDNIPGSLANFSFYAPAASNTAVAAAIAAGERTDLQGAIDASLAAGTFALLQVAAGSDVVFSGAGGEERLNVTGNRGGGIALLAGSSLTFANDPASTNGGAIYLGTTSFLSLTAEAGARYLFDGNTVGSNNYGGAIYLSRGASLYVENATFTNNAAGWHGGAIYNYGGSLTVTDSVFQGNIAGAPGGQSARGGAIYNQESTVTLTDVSFLQNHASRDSGAIFNWNGTIDLAATGTNTVTFSGNTDPAGANSIFFYAASGGVARLNIDTEAGAAVDMLDPMRDETNQFSSSYGSIEITKTGDGVWRLGGANVFTSDSGNIGYTTFTVSEGTLSLYGAAESANATLRNDNAMVETASIRLDGTRSRFEMAADTTLLVGGENSITTDGAILLNDGVLVQAAASTTGVSLTLSRTTLSGEVTFDAGSGQCLLLNGVFTGDDGTFIKTGAGEVTLGATASAIASLEVREGVLGLIAGSEPNVTADSVTFAAGTSLNISGFTGSALGETVTLIQSATTITNIPTTYTVGGETSANYISVLVGAGDGGRSVVATLGLTWYGGTNNGDGLFTLSGADSSFDVGTVLADRDGIFASGWDGKSLTKNGAGTLILSADNTYTGLTTIEDGTLTLTTLGGSGVNAADMTVVIDAAGTLNFDILPMASGEYHKTIVGAGGIGKNGTGQVILTADNSGFTGTVEVNDGVLAATSDASVGSAVVTIHNPGVFALRYNGEFSNAVAGGGTLASYGDITLTGDSSGHFGLTQAAAGTLTVATDYVSAATFQVMNGALLTGDGTVGGLDVMDGGTVNPGYLLGTLTVAGDALFETGSTYTVQIDATSNDSDQIAVAGTTTIGSGALMDVQVVNVARMNPGDTADYLVIAGSSFTDDTLFDAAEGHLGYNLTQVLEADGLHLRVVATTPDFGGFASVYGSPNARRAAEALDDLYRAGAVTGMEHLFDALANLSADPMVVARAFDQLHGEVYAAGQDASLRLRRSFDDASRIARRKDSGASSAAPAAYGSLVGGGDGPGLWAAFTGTWLNRSGVGRYSGSRLEGGGVAVGLDLTTCGRWFFGAGFGYNKARQTFDDLPNRADIEAGHSLLYGGYAGDAWQANAYAGYSKNWHRTRRHIAIGSGAAGFAATARARYNDDLFSAGLEADRHFCWDAYTLTPSVGLHYRLLQSPRIAERGGGEAALRVSGRSHTSVRLPVGVRLGRDFGVGCFTWRPEVRAYYTAELADDSSRVQTRFASAPDIPFIAKTGSWGRHTGTFGAGLEGRIREKMTLRLDYEYEVARRAQAHELALTFALTW